LTGFASDPETGADARSRREENGGQVKAREIVQIALLFFLGFMMVEFLIAHMEFDDALQRFLARVILLAPFYFLVYMVFTVRDLQRKLRLMEVSHSQERRLWSRERALRLKHRIKNHGKGGYGRYTGKPGSR
jgi:hypothetical protein